jgi:hypothetical protein
MKTKILTLSLVASLFFISCSKDEQIDTPINATDVSSNAKIDDISDFVLQVVESQSNRAASNAGRNSSSASSQTSCATITTQESTDGEWIRTIDYGATNCTLSNGNMVRGKIIITFLYDFNSTTRKVYYTFDNFYHNDRRVEGSKTVIKTVLENGHPQATINLNFKITDTDGKIYSRIGTRVREFIQGYDTSNDPLDNVFSITGNWTTTFPNGANHVATITSPLIIKSNCDHIVSGTIKFEKARTTAILDYGNGDCDAKATVTINGLVRDINL